MGGGRGPDGVGVEAVPGPGRVAVGGHWKGAPSLDSMLELQTKATTTTTTEDTALIAGRRYGVSATIPGRLLGMLGGGRHVVLASEWALELAKRRVTRLVLAQPPKLSFTFTFFAISPLELRRHQS